MEPVELKFCEVHSPLFVAGTNLGLKLDPARRDGLTIHFNEEKKRLVVGWNQEIGWVPEPNIVVMIPGSPKLKPALLTHPMVAGISSSAQVETPYGHVHAGPGKGKK